MRFFWLSIFLLPSFCLADLTCDIAAVKSLKLIAENPPAYQLEYYGFKLKAGGSHEQAIGSFDKEAVKRTFTTCAPGIIKCLKRKKRRKISGELLATLDLEPKNGELKISKVQFSSQSGEKSGFYACAEEIITRGLIALPPGTEKVQIKIPFNVTPTCTPVPADLQQDEGCASPSQVTDLDQLPAKPVLSLPPTPATESLASDLVPTNFKGFFAFTDWTDGSNKKNDVVGPCFKVNQKMLDRLKDYDSCNNKSKVATAAAECERKDGAHAYFFKKRNDCEKSQTQKGIAEEL